MIHLIIRHNCCPHGGRSSRVAGVACQRSCRTVMRHIQSIIYNARCQYDDIAERNLQQAWLHVLAMSRWYFRLSARQQGLIGRRGCLDGCLGLWAHIVETRGSVCFLQVVVERRLIRQAHLPHEPCYVLVAGVVCHSAAATQSTKRELATFKGKTFQHFAKSPRNIGWNENGKSDHQTQGFEKLARGARAPKHPQWTCTVLVRRSGRTSISRCPHTAPAPPCQLV
jgi:hypothetical protein